VTCRDTEVIRCARGGGLVAGRRAVPVCDAGVGIVRGVQARFEVVGYAR
jgi:hypothetical protein